MLTADWQDLVAAISTMPDLLKGMPEEERAAGMQYLLRFLSAGLRVCIEADETDAPMLTRSIEHRMSWGLDNPDTTYLYSRLDPSQRYVLVGDRGTARHMEVQVNTGHQGDGDFAGWQATWWRTGDELGQDVRLEIPPTDGASFLLIRQYFSDWSDEQPARLDLQSLDVALPPGPLQQPELAMRMGLLVQWLSTGRDCWAQLSSVLMGSVDAAQDAWSVQPFLPPDAASGLKGQAYGMGGWHCAPDEALIVHVDPPSSRYWGVSLCDRYWQSIDFAQRQSSLNDSQARPDRDGGVTCVVAHDDPGVANWLDPGGRTAGTLAVRYLSPVAGELPPVTIERVPRDQLSARVPGGVARTNADERQRVLRERQTAVARRMAW